jgi:tight adherence protein C
MILVIAVIFGIVIFMVIYSIYQILSEVPDEDRSFLDRPPIGFRLLWPLIKLMVFYIGPRLSMTYRMQTQARLRRAGVDYSLSPEQYFAGKILAGFLMGLAGYAVLAMLETQSLVMCLAIGAFGFYYPEIWLRENTTKRHNQIFRVLPFYLDIITLSVEAGSNLTGAFTQAVKKTEDGPLRMEINRVLRDIRAGKPRAEALRAMADRVDMPGINSLVSSLVQADKTGSSLGPVLRAQADQRRIERFLKAEKLAMEAPVKLLGPLVMFIFPNTFIVLIFVLMVKAVQAGVISSPGMLWALSWPG